MSIMTANAMEWIQNTCRHFTIATGWPLDFIPANSDRKDTLLQSLEQDPRCCWFTQLKARPDQSGFLRLYKPEDTAANTSLTQARELAHLVSQMFSHVAIETESAQTQVAEMEALVDAATMLPDGKDLPKALTQLLRVAIQLTGFRAAAFYLLAPNSQELHLRIVHRLETSAVPYPVRNLSEMPPDLHALKQGHLTLQGDVYPEDRPWLPDELQTGVCVSVETNEGPIGTLWAFHHSDWKPRQRDARVLESISTQLAMVLERAVLLSENESSHRLQQEMKVASESQLLVTENTMQSLPGLEIASLCTSRQAVGGDLCEVIRLDDHQLLISVGDASGDSVPAALIRAAVQGALRTMTNTISSTNQICTAEIMRHINRVLYGITPAYQFMSLFLGVLDKRNNNLLYTNAGHPVPLLHHNGEFATLDSHGMLLGVMLEATYEQSVLPLSTGDLLTLYSDGISEARNIERELFRSQGIMEAVSKSADLSAKQILQQIWDDMEQFSAGRNDSDDRTLLVIRTLEETDSEPDTPATG